MLEILRHPAWQSVGVLVALLIALMGGLGWLSQDYYPLYRYLRQSELISTHNLVHNEVCKLTPKGVRAAEQLVAS